MRKNCQLKLTISRRDIDNVLEQKPKDFDDFLSLMKALGYEIKQGKNLIFKETPHKEEIKIILRKNTLLTKKRFRLSGIKNPTLPLNFFAAAAKIIFIFELCGVSSKV